jgi:hypothetical protein
VGIDIGICVKQKEPSKAAKTVDGRRDAAS